jgi:hypothetical protein
LLESYPDVVKKFIGRNTGIYALYRKEKLYYVGLATALRGRLRAHIKNRHSNSWDRFSIYLTIKDQHLREIEALLLRIANPPGARQRGKLAQSKDMRRQIKSEIKKNQQSEVSTLLGRKLLNPASKVARTSEADTELLKLFPQGAKIRGTNNGKVFRARILASGKVRYGRTSYASLSHAAYSAVGRSINGWWFWQIERGRGNWVRLSKIRNVGTPIYPR